jgi:hypothetical protein
MLLPLVQTSPFSAVQSVVPQVHGPPLKAAPLKLSHDPYVRQRFKDFVQKEPDEPVMHSAVPHVQEALFATAPFV